MLIYAAIGAFGMFLLLVMLLVGEVSDLSHDVAFDLAHDVGHGGGPSVLSLRVIAPFLTAFGVGGVVARHYDLSHPAASGMGIVAGVVMAGIVLQFAKLLNSQQVSTELTMRSLLGETATVTVAIPTAGLGQIQVSARGELSEHLARSADGRSVARGRSVIVMEIGGDAVLVRPRLPLED